MGKPQNTGRHFVREAHIPRDICSREHISLENTYHCDTRTMRALEAVRMTLLKIHQEV